MQLDGWETSARSRICKIEQPCKLAVDRHILVQSLCEAYGTSSMYHLDVVKISPYR